MNNTILINMGMKLLIENLGNVDAEKFVSLLLKDPFDYTKWQRSLFDGMTIEQISEQAMKKYKKS